MGAGTTRVVSHDQVLALALRCFHEQSCLDMEQLAAELAVSRATLYRVVGSRERLLGDVLWHQGARAMDHHHAEIDAVGAERFLTLAERFNRGLIDYAPMRRFLREEPDTAYRVLFMPEARVHSRFVQLWRDLFTAAESRGEIRLPFDAGELAYVWVRIGESMLYADLLAGLEPKVELARRVQCLLLSDAAAGISSGAAPWPERA
jgi:AcrR family transcriptional regulator